VGPTAGAELRLSFRAKAVVPRTRSAPFFSQHIFRNGGSGRNARPARRSSPGCLLRCIVRHERFPMPLPIGKPTVEARLCSLAHGRRQYVSVDSLHRYGFRSFFVLRCRKLRSRELVESVSRCPDTRRGVTPSQAHAPFCQSSPFVSSYSRLVSNSRGGTDEEVPCFPRACRFRA
jgi:hypothetical protein